MRDNKEILMEIKEQVIKNNYYGVDNICLLAMEQSNKEYKDDIVNALENLSNNYRVIDGCYVIEKSVLDNFIDNLDTFGTIFLTILDITLVILMMYFSLLFYLKITKKEFEFSVPLKWFNCEFYFLMNSDILRIGFYCL